MLYVPGGTLTKTYWPAALEVLVRSSFVDVSVKVIAAPGTTAPVLSVTTPLICPAEVTCAPAGTALARSRIATIRTKVENNKRERRPSRVIFLLPPEVD
jgi:hypothetical protein